MGTQINCAKEGGGLFFLKEFITNKSGNENDFSFNHSAPPTRQNEQETFYIISEAGNRIVYLLVDLNFIRYVCIYGADQSCLFHLGTL